MSRAQVTGSCLCGAVAFHVELPTLFCGHCHCSMCRRNHGAAYVTWFGVLYEQFEIDQGIDVLVRHASSEHGSRRFCGKCGSSLFCESTQHPDHIDIVLANMDGPIDKAPQFHGYWESRADWAQVGDELPRLRADAADD
ncbi:MAG: GFA family protein [Myxococcota bacterium]